MSGMPMRFLPLLAVACSTIPRAPTLAVVEVDAPLVCDMRRMDHIFRDLDLYVEPDVLRIRRGGPDRRIPRDLGLQDALVRERERLEALEGRLGDVTLYVDVTMPLQETITLLDVLPKGFERVHLATSGRTPME